MDWIAWYLIFWLVISLIVNLVIHGKAKEGYYDFRIWFVAGLLMLPVYGRIFGWW